VGWIPRSIVVVTLTLLLAELSYRFVEMPIRREEVPVPVLVIGGVALLTVIGSSAFFA
jgi:peptidoglycan/LPS O-acetylase OafA/YrhL